MDMVSPYMTVQDVAAYLRVKPKTIYAWASERRIPTVKLNGLLRFRREEIEAWAKSSERRATPAPAALGRPPVVPGLISTESLTTPGGKC